jgi:V/A-type H+-transporting ATPase subunit I
MAIVKMNKITLVGLEGCKEQVIDTLMKMGTVEIADVKASEEELEKLVFKDGDEASVARLEDEISRVKSAIDYLSKYDTRKKRLFEGKRHVTPESYNEIISSKDLLWDVVEQIDKYDGRLTQLRNEENRLVNMIATLRPWQALDIPLEISSTKSTVLLLGVVPSITDTNKLSEEISRQAEECCFWVVSSDSDQKYLFIIYHKELEELVGGILKQYGFTRISFKELEGTPEENIRRAENRIKEINKERAENEKRIAGLAGEKQKLEVFHDYLTIIRDRKNAFGSLIRTEKAFMLEGWVPEEISENVIKALEIHGDCLVDIRKPEKDEEFPILLKNNSFVKPFEIITELYSLPDPKGIDPSMFLAPFFFIFFGMMVSDAGYGLLMAIATGIILYKLKPKGMAYKLIKLMFFGGISTLIWGALFGGWFGNIVEAVTSGKYTIPPIWFNPLDDPMKLLLWSFIFGGVHIFVGMGLNGYLLIKEGKTRDAIFDVGFWYIFLVGLIIFGLGSTKGKSGVLLANIGKYMAIAGAVLLILTQGRNQKSIIKKLTSGILSLYNVTGFMSDVLSYSRLLALGLATGVIAAVINTMGTLFGLNAGGIIVLIIVFTIGTIFNILINALGAFVHASRLQYVEFFGKFYEGGGKAFQPLKINTKYTKITKQEAS